MHHEKNHKQGAYQNQSMREYKLRNESINCGSRTCHLIESCTIRWMGWRWHARSGEAVLPGDRSVRLAGVVHFSASPKPQSIFVARADKRE